MQIISDGKNTNKNEFILNQLTVEDIEKFYLNGCKNELKIGLEYERLSLDKNTLKSAEYERVEAIIKHFASIKKWDLIYDDTTIIGAKDNKGTSISLEPGCQIELSLAPKKDIVVIEIEASRILDLLDKIADIYDIRFIGYGVTPVSSVDEIKLLDKRRYKIMNNYLPYCLKGTLCPKMMRQSAGIQINVDYKNKKDAYNKLKLFNLILPFISGLCSNSPFEFNSKNELKSIRNHIWRHTGQNRCNLFYRNIFKKKFFKYQNVFKNYINEILKVPMVLIERDNEFIAIDGKINFKDFMRTGYQGYYPEYDDYITQQSLCFPDIRLKNYIEIRNHDSSSLEIALALCTLYKGLCLNDINELLKKFKYLKIDETDNYFKLASINGLDFQVDKINAWDIALNICNVASLKLDSKERIYLEPFYKMIIQKKTKADIIIDCDIKNPKELINFF